MLRVIVIQHITLFNFYLLIFSSYLLSKGHLGICANSFNCVWVLPEITIFVECRIHGMWGHLEGYMEGVNRRTNVVLRVVYVTGKGAGTSEE